MKLPVISETYDKIRTALQDKKTLSNTVRYARTCDQTQHEVQPFQFSRRTTRLRTHKSDENRNRQCQDEQLANLRLAQPRQIV